MQRIETRTLVQYALFIGIIFLMGLTPYLGYITLPFAAITIVHLPVIIGSYRFGVKGGAVFGAFFGLTSLITCFTRPDAIAAIVLGTSTGFGLYNIFLILMVLFLPRVLTGVFSALVFKALSRISDAAAMAVAAVVGSLTNTVFLLGSLYLFAFNQAGTAFGLAPGYTGGELALVLLGIVAFNGMLEAAAAMLLCTTIGKALSHLLDSPRPSRLNKTN